MSKIISYKHLSIGAVLFAAAFALQFVPALSRAQVLVKPASQAQPAPAPAASPAASIVKPNAGATPAQEAQLRAIAEDSHKIKLRFTGEVLKPVMKLKEGETMQISVLEQNSNTQVPVVVERNPKGFCAYVQDDITFDFEKLLRVARAQSGFGLGLIIDKVLAQNSATVTVDKNFPNSVCFENVRRAFTFFGNITFAQSIVNEVLAQGAALLAEAKAASCPRNIQKLAADIENACTRIKNVPQCYIARQAALKKLLMKDKKFVNCAISDYITLPMFDWGDADPAVTGRTTAAQKGPFAAVNQKLKLGKIVNGERDANIIDNDGDDGLTRVAAGVMGGTYEVRSTALVGAQRVFLTIDRFVRPGVVERLRNGPVGTGEAVTNIGKLKDGLYRIYLTSHPVPGPGVGKTGQAPGGNLGTGEIEDWSIPLTKQNGVVCAAVLDYVCGVNGQTYNNECEAGRAGVKVAAKGKCPPPGPGKEPGGCPEAPAVQCAPGTVPQASAGADGCPMTTCVPSGAAPSAVFDFGDAPAPYPTTLEERGIHHRIGDVWLGGAPQTRAVNAEADALRPDRDQFDDGLALVRAQTVPPPPDSVRVTRAPAPQGGRPLPSAFLNVLDDRNDNGRWEPAEWVVQNQIARFTSGNTQTVELRNPQNKPVTLSRNGVARITVTTGRLQNYRGLAPNNQPISGGETEDYVWRIKGIMPPIKSPLKPSECPPPPAVQCAPGTVPQASAGADGCPMTTCVPSGAAPTPPTPSAVFDFGDATLGFPTLLSENGPRHVLSNRVWLGDRIDGESDGLRTNRDDEVGVDDEDGMLNSNPQFVLLVRTGPNLTTHTVYINAWEDWNANNRWDINANGAPGDEWIVRNQPVQVGSNTVQNALLVQPRNGPDGQPLPAAWSDPAFWVRFTVTETRIPNGNPALGQFPSGETEDYIGVPPPAPSVPGVPGGDRGLDASGASVPTGGGGAAAGGIEIKL